MGETEARRKGGSQGDTLKRLRLQSGLTQKVLAQAARISVRTALNPTYSLITYVLTCVILTLLLSTLPERKS